MRKKPIIIGVTGGSGGGKTSVSKAILANFKDQKIAMIQHDSYYKDQSHLTFEERVSTNYDHPLAFYTFITPNQKYFLSILLHFYHFLNAENSYLFTK